MYRCLLTISLLALVAVEGNAQQFGRPPVTTPTFSPYLNLLRQGNPAINYYGLVRPEQEWRKDIGQLRQSVQGIDTTLDEATGANALMTGHPTQFQNVSHFFPGSRQAGPSLGRPAGGTVTPTINVGSPPVPPAKGGSGKK